MRKRVFNALLCLIGIVMHAQQNPSLRGKVIDSKNQKPLQNAVAAIESTNQSVTTDKEGNFYFKGIPSGNNTLTITYTGYKSKTFILEPTTETEIDLGSIPMEEDITTELQLSLVTITENDLGDDNSGSESTSGLLQASRDTYQQVAAFNWGQARFRIRGLDNAYGKTMINGIPMNKIYDGRPQWSNWGGLNDATRNQEFTMGSSPSDYTFGGPLGTQEINTRASHYRPGTRISFSGTNTNYSWRTMGTHASGLDKNGWAYVISGSRRWAKEGYFEGTDYSANSFFVSFEKKINEKHSLNFTSIYAQNSRAKSSPNTQEVTDLKGIKYNSYWGWQNGKKRNSREKDILEPINILSHYWKITESTSLNTNVSFQTGTIGNSRIDNQLANNPDPTYYKYLPSYYLNQHDDNGNWTPNYALAEIAKSNFLANSQMNWNEMYIANQNSANPGKSVYVLYEDRTDDQLWSANSILNTSLTNNISLNAAINFKRLKSHNHQNLLDLLGGQYFLDTDPFFDDFGTDAIQSDLNNPNRQVRENESYGYNYNLFATVMDGFTQFKFSYNKINFYLSQSYSRSEYKREGLYRNGVYANNSFGKSEAKVFENFGFKGGLTYKFNGRHMLDLNGLYMTAAPNLRNTFANARLNNSFTPNLESETIMGGDISYIIRAPKLKARITGFFNQINNSTEISFFYGEGIGEVSNDAAADSFISEIVTGLDKQSLGGELGVEYQVTSTIKATLAASYGQYIYSNNAQLVTNDDNIAAQGRNPLRDFGTTYLKNYHQPGMPQQAYSFGLEYRDPHFWWIGANANYIGGSYLDVSSIIRTNNFTISPSGLPYDGATEENVRTALKQEKFDDFMLFNLIGGKSWRISSKNRNTFGFFASINNILDVEYKTGGFEQSRKATYTDLQQDLVSGTRAFGPKYFYGYGRTYFVNVYFNF